MAGTNSTPCRGRRGPVRCYTPRPIRLVPGVTHRAGDHLWDAFRGTMDALVEAGVADRWMFPGQPGVGPTSASYRPPGGSNTSPRYVTLLRQRDGRFLARVVVSEEEQAARLCAYRARRHRERLAAAHEAAGGAGSVGSFRRFMVALLVPANFDGQGAVPADREEAYR